MKPSESLITQLDIYTEEKFEDEEDLRERNLAGHRRAVSDSEIVLEDLIHSAKQYTDLYPTIVESISHFRTLIEHPGDMYVPLQLDRDVTQIPVIVNSRRIYYSSSTSFSSKSLLSMICMFI